MTVPSGVLIALYSQICIQTLHKFIQHSKQSIDALDYCMLLLKIEITPFTSVTEFTSNCLPVCFYIRHLLITFPSIYNIYSNLTN